MKNYHQNMVKFLLTYIVRLCLLLSPTIWSHGQQLDSVCIELPEDIVKSTRLIFGEYHRQPSNIILYKLIESINTDAPLFVEGQFKYNLYLHMFLYHNDTTILKILNDTYKVRQGSIYHNLVREHILENSPEARKTLSRINFFDTNGFRNKFEYFSSYYWMDSLRNSMVFHNLEDDFFVENDSFVCNNHFRLLEISIQSLDGDYNYRRQLPSESSVLLPFTSWKKWKFREELLSKNISLLQKYLSNDSSYTIITGASHVGRDSSLAPITKGQYPFSINLLKKGVFVIVGYPYHARSTNHKFENWEYQILFQDFASIDSKCKKVQFFDVKHYTTSYDYYMLFTFKEEPKSKKTIKIILD